MSNRKKEQSMFIKKKERKVTSLLSFSVVTCNIYFRTILTFYYYHITIFKNFLAGISLVLYSIPTDILRQNQNEISKSKDFYCIIYDEGYVDSKFYFCCMRQISTTSLY